MSPEQKGNKDNRANSWAKRLRADVERLDEERKLRILSALCTDFIGLTEDETELFLAPTTPLDEGGIPDADGLTYLSAENKVGNFYSGANPEEEDSRRPKFLGSFREALEGFYSESELDELFGFITPDPRADTLVVKWLVGSEHYVNKRIRNIYLPLITDIYEVGTEGIREVDIFDTDEEPGDAMDRYYRDRSAK